MEGDGPSKEGTAPSGVGGTPARGDIVTLMPTYSLSICFVEESVKGIIYM